MREWLTEAGINPELRRGAAASAALHLVIILALLIGLPLWRPAEPPPEESVAVVFQGQAETTMKAPQPAPNPAPANTPAPLPLPPAVQPPKPMPNEAAPPPPPPPPAPPPSPAPEAALPLPPTPVPPPQPTAEPAPMLPAPPPPVPAPPKPVQTQPPPAPPLPLPPLPVPPPPMPSATSQPNPTKNPAPQSDALDNTLERLRAMVRQKSPPLTRYNPAQGGAPNGGGSPTGNDTSALSAAERGAIGDHVRPCWTSDPGALDLDRMQALLTVTTDQSGVVREAAIAPADQGKLGNPRFRAFAERAVRAVMDPACATLPLPKSMLGKINVLTFRFSP